MSFVKLPQELLAGMGRPFVVYDAQMLTVVWETKPEIVRRLLPPPLLPVGQPLVMAFVANYPRTSSVPAYKEGALFLRAEFENQEGSYCLAMPVTGDIAMAGGREVWGFPKKMADITFERRRNQMTCRLERHGQPFFELKVDLDSPPNDAAFQPLFDRLFPTDAGGTMSAVAYNFKQFPSVTGMGFDYNPRLVRVSLDMRSHTVAIGRAEVSLPPADNDPWFEVEVVKVLGAVLTVGDNTLNFGEVVAEADPMAFAPYAFLKWD